MRDNKISSEGGAAVPDEAAMVEKIADELGAKFRPARIEERRRRPPLPVFDVEDDDEYFAAKYETVEVPAGDANDATMVTFRAEDGHLSIRALTWREVVAAAAPVFRAAVLREAADEIEKAITAYLPDGLDHCEVAANDAYRGAAMWLRSLAAGGSPEVDNNEREARDA